MTEYKLFIINDIGTYEITDYTGNISWSDSLDTLGVQLDFVTAFSDEKYFQKIDINAGDKVILKGEDIIFTGIIVSQSINGKTEKSYTCFDFAVYLNKSMVIKQFKKISAGTAIKQLCLSAGINIGEIAKMNKLINHIYKDSTIADIIDDIINQESSESGKKFIKEMREDKFYIIEQPKTPIEVFFKPAENVSAFNIAQYPGNISKTLSIEEMKNSIIIVSNSEKSTRIIAHAKDNKSIDKYGLFQEITTVDDKELSKAKNIAENILKEKNTINESISLQLIGNKKIKAGRILQLEESKTELKGLYRIISSKHTISKGIYTVDTELEAVK